MIEFETLGEILTLEHVFGLLLTILLIGYLFFALFLYLRIRILSYTLRTPYSGTIRYIVFVHMVVVLVIFLLLGGLVWLL